jgi:hypothetical protein
VWSEAGDCGVTQRAVEVQVKFDFVEEVHVLKRSLRFKTTQVAMSNSITSV